MLEVKEVDQSFRVGFWLKRVQVLRGISLSVPSKCIFGFLGANGAGKTTLIHLLVGLRRPTRGTVEVGGFEASSSQARERIGYLPERPYFHEHLTGEGLLRYFGTLAGMDHWEIASRIPKVLETVGMSQAAKVELKRYSKGMLQRIGIAQAILHDPEYLILDEPMSGLDPLGRKEIRELIVRLAGEGRTIFFSTHVIPDVEAICDRVALIQKGKLLGCGPIEQFLAHGTSETEIAFTGLGVDSVSGQKGFSSVRQIPDGVRATATGDINEILRDLISSGAKIMWVNPIRPSLEDLFGSEFPRQEGRP